MNNFKAAASRYSISGSSNIGGELGWIIETLVSNEINNILSKMEDKNISPPIKYPNGYLILKINEKRIVKEEINIDKELDELYNFETNKQLNQFSLLFFKKLKQSMVINEY